MSLRSRIALRTRFRRLVFSTFYRDELTRLCNKHGTDKGTIAHAQHAYSRHYHRAFRHLRDSPITLLEIGLCADANSRIAPSLAVWRSYFPKARIIGFDINDFSHIEMYNCTTIQGDSSSRNDLHELGQINGPFDIIIEDASHASRHQQVALASLFPYVRPGGFFCIEDLNWQPKDLESGAIPKTRALLRAGHFSSPAMTPDESSYLSEHIDQIRFFNSWDIGIGNKDRTDALAIIQKRAILAA